MNFGRGASVTNKSKLVEAVQNSSPQLRDYYEMFGKKRDLEQYFISQTYERKSPLGVVDSLELIEGRDCHLTQLKGKALFESQVRFDMAENEKQSSPDIEIREIQDSSPSPRISLKSGGSPANSPEQDLQDSAVNATSPGTLSSSKKLEWDSLGDVGYDNARRGKEIQQKEGDYGHHKEDKNRNSPLTLNYKVGKPTAQSTPNAEESSKLSLERKNSPEKSPRKSTGIHKKSGKYQLTYKSNKSSNFNLDVKKYYSFNIPTGDKSHYEETEQFHFDTKLSSPELKENKRNVAGETIQRIADEIQKTDREIQTISKDIVSMSAQTDNTNAPHGYLHRDVAEGEIGPSCNEDLQAELAKGSSNTSRAESFEYIPGCEYQNPNYNDSLNLIDIQGNTSRSQDVAHSKSFKSISSKDIVKMIEKSSSSQDVGPCIHKISKMLQLHKDNPAIIKKVVKKIGKLLVQINYPSDNETQSSGTTPTSGASSDYSRSKSKNSIIKNKTDSQCDQQISENFFKNNNVVDDNCTNTADKTETVLFQDESNHPKEIIDDDNLNEMLVKQSNEEKDIKNDDVDSKNNNKETVLINDVNSEKTNNEVQVLSFHNTNVKESVENKSKEIKLSSLQNILNFFDKVVDKADKKDYSHGIRSAPSTLSYANYLEKKAGNTQGDLAANYLNEKPDDCGVIKTNHGSLESQQNQRKDKKYCSNTERISHTDVETITDTNTQLLKVNEEICKLTSLKLKLENKHRPDTLKALIAPQNDKGETLARHIDKGASGDMSFRNAIEEPVLVYYNSVRSPQAEEYSTRVPPLNLQNSSSECSLETDRNNDLTDKRGGGTTCCTCKESTTMVSIKSVCTCESNTRQFVASSENERNKPSQAIATSKTSTTTSSGLCACCRCRALCSQSSSAESCSAELRKYQKIYDKYQKCLTMKAFVKEYDELIEKYKNLKDKKLAQSSTKGTERISFSKDIPVQQKPVRGPSYATTSTAPTHKNACCGNAIECINRGTSPLDTNRSHRTTDVACQNLSRRSSEVSDQLVNKVRKAFAKEYEDITRRLENIKCNCECIITQQPFFESQVQSNRSYHSSITAKSNRSYHSSITAKSNRSYHSSITAKTTDDKSIPFSRPIDIITQQPFFESQVQSNRSYHSSITAKTTDDKSIPFSRPIDIITQQPFFESQVQSNRSYHSSITAKTTDDKSIPFSRPIDIITQQPFFESQVQSNRSYHSSITAKTTDDKSIPFSRPIDIITQQPFFESQVQSNRSYHSSITAKTTDDKSIPFSRPIDIITQQPFFESQVQSNRSYHSSITAKTTDDKSIPFSRPIDNVDSTVGVTSEYSEGPLPLSSQEYIMIEEESYKCKCRENCTCAKTSNEWLTREGSVASAKSRSINKSSALSVENFEKEPEKCKCCLRKKVCRDRPHGGSVSSSKNMENMSNRRVDSVLNKDVRSSGGNEMVEKKPKEYKHRCNVACACAKHETKYKSDSTELSSSANIQSHKYQDSQSKSHHSKSSKRSSHSKNGSSKERTTSKSRNGECSKDCKCARAFKKQESASSEAVLPNTKQASQMFGSTFRKSDKEVNGKKNKHNDQQKCKCANCSCRKKERSSVSKSESSDIAASVPKANSQSSKIKEPTSDDSVVMCLWCKAIPIDSDCKVCDHCLNKHQQYVENVIQRKRYICKSIPKAVAYNLIVESSESILEETYQSKPKTLDKVYVKTAKSKLKKNQHRAPRIEEGFHEDKGSTDEQIRELSSLNSELNNGIDDEVPSQNDFQGNNYQNRNGYDDKTLREMLEQNRPDFVSNTNGRQEILKKYNAVRRLRDAEQRKKLLHSVHSLHNINQDILEHLESNAHAYGLFLPKTSDKNGFHVFNSKQMIKEARRKYQHLPEIEKKKLNKKKQDYKKTNLVMAGIFSRKLQRKTLKGIVDISHSRQVIAL